MTVSVPVVAWLGLGAAVTAFAGMVAYVTGCCRVPPAPSPAAPVLGGGDYRCARS